MDILLYTTEFSFFKFWWVLLVLVVLQIQIFIQITKSTVGVIL